MKKILTAFALVIFGFAAFAQQEEGDIILRFNGSYSKYGDASGTANLNIKGGRFFSKNLESGVEMSIMGSSGFSNVSTGFYATYNFLTKDAKMVPYAGLRASSTASSFSFTNPLTGTESTTTDSYVTGGFYGGVRYFMTEKVNIDTGLSYDFGKINILMWNIGIGVIVGRK